MNRPTSGNDAFGLGDVLALAREATIRVAWGKISEAVRSSGKEIVKDPRLMARLLREAADALDRWADDRKLPK